VRDLDVSGLRFACHHGGVSVRYCRAAAATSARGKAEASSFRTHVVQPKTIGESRRATHVLFDLDGVLLDTEPLYTEATQAVVGRFGKTYDWALKRHTMGRDARLSARFL